jgi:hypothetical protein
MFLIHYILKRFFGEDYEKYMKRRPKKIKRRR